MDSSYCQRRVEQERLAAEAALDVRARRCHEQLATLHASPAASARANAEDDCEPSGPGLIILTRV